MKGNTYSSRLITAFTEAMAALYTNSGGYRMV